MKDTIPNYVAVRIQMAGVFSDDGPNAFSPRRKARASYNGLEFLLLWKSDNAPYRARAKKNHRPSEEAGGLNAPYPAHRSIVREGTMAPNGGGAVDAKKPIMIKVTMRG